MVLWHHHFSSLIGSNPGCIGVGFEAQYHLGGFGSHSFQCAFCSLVNREFFFLGGGGWLVLIFCGVEVGRLLTQNMDPFDVWWIFYATIWNCNWTVSGCAPEKGTISSLPSSIFRGRSITVDHGHAEVLPPEAVTLCRSKSPDAFIMLDAAHGFFGSLAAAQIWWFSTPLHPDTSFQLPTPWLVVWAEDYRWS